MTAQPTELRLRKICLEAEDICSYEFVAADGGVLPPFGAGAHLDLQLPGGRVRSYSLAALPDDRASYLIAVQREEHGRGGSTWMHESLRVGQTLRAALPSNDFPLNETAGHSVFIAGGIGITPIISMIARLEELGRSWELHYATRGPQYTAFMSQLEQLERGRGRVSYCFNSDRAARLDLSRIVSTADAETHLYCCGPARMIDAFLEAGRGRSASTMHFERFAAADEPAVEGGYTVVLNRTGKRLTVEPGKTILETLLDENVPVDYACSNGICGTCLTSVISGVPDHRDDFLSEEERRSGKSMLVCCSGSLTPELILDI